MIRYEADKEKGIITLSSAGSGLELISETLAFISGMYENIKETKPEGAEGFKYLLQTAIADNSSPVWNNTYGKENKKND